MVIICCKNRTLIEEASSDEDRVKRRPPMGEETDTKDAYLKQEFETLKGKNYILHAFDPYAGNAA